MTTKKETPLLKQYNKIKAKYPDTILLFRLGDFYETFNDDAVITSKVCGITLTKRNNGKADEIPLAGFPHHQLDAYLPKLVRAGYRAAVCEQLEDPKQAKGVVKRGVTEVVTPGVALYDKLLESKKNTYLAALYYKNIKNGPEIVGFSFTDASTGEYFTTDIHLRDLETNLEAVLPSEIIISKSQKDKLLPKLKTLSFEPSLTFLDEWIFETEFCEEILLKQFKTKNLKGFGIENLEAGKISAGVVLHYLNETQNKVLNHINSVSIYDTSDHMLLDTATRRNLEIILTMQGEREGSLYSILDDTLTPMGGRLLKKWISRPLKKLDKIHLRLDAVETFYSDNELSNNCREVLENIGDIERLSTKIATLRANPRDLVSLKNSLQQLPLLNETLKGVENKYIQKLTASLDNLEQLEKVLETAIKEDPSILVGTGNVFKDGYNEELDEYKAAKFSGKNWISKYQKEQREKTGINTLKVGFNSVFGYYIEVTKVHSSKVPESYNRKQTLTNSERYITPELKEFENKIYTAEEKIEILEKELYSKLLDNIQQYLNKLKTNSFIISQLDCLQSYAFTSKSNNYIKPEVDESKDLNIEEGRHPVVENTLPPGESYTNNSTKYNYEEELIHIITGPNMSGKSCYLRQTAIIVLMAQIGCFVPAESAKFGMIDKIYTRVGAGDNIRTGESTFLVEMQEAANILNNATEKSLILLDEVGRGTATFDGISIAWAITEYIHNKIKAKTLFATHYHELNDLANRYDRIKNFKVDVIERDANIIFTHKVKEGSADHSFGIYVAKMAGLPYDIITRADEIMKILEGNTKQESIKDDLHSAKPNMNSIDTKKPDEDGQMAIFAFEDDKLRKRLKEINIEGITPIQAFQILSDLVQDTKKG